MKWKFYIHVPFIRKVIEELDLYISYAAEGSFHNIELYKSSPIKVWITP